MVKIHIKPVYLVFVLLTIADKSNNQEVNMSGDEAKDLKLDDLNEKICFYLSEKPSAGPREIALFCGVADNSVTRALKPNGFPASWTKETVENTLNDIVWKNARGVTLRDLKGGRFRPNIPLWKAFIFYEFPASYPLNDYRKEFHKLIYALLGMDVPRNPEEEWGMEWPKNKTLRKRYLSLMRLHHPDYHHQDYKRAKVATINCQLIADAYQKLLNRKKFFTMGTPPPIQKEEAAIHSKKNLD